MLGRASCCLAITLAVFAGNPGPAGAEGEKTWSEVQVIGLTPPGGDASIAASGTNVYILYGADPIYVRHSSDSGTTFSAPTVISNSGAAHETDSLAAEGDDAFAVTFVRTRTVRDTCCDRDLGNLVVHRSTDAGASWQHAVPLTSAGGAFRVSIAVSLPYVHVAWSDYRGDRWAIYYRRSTDGGATWEPEEQLVPPALDGTNRPQLAAIGKTVHLTWMDDRDGNGPCYVLPHCTETYYMRSVDGGKTWGSLRRLTFNQPQRPLLSGRPDVDAFSDGPVVIAYDQDLKFGESSVQHYLRSADGGQTWQPPTLIGRKPEETHPAAAALGRTGVIAWFEQRSGLSLGIYAHVSEDSGATWQKKERVSVSDRLATTPHVAVTPGLVHVMWLEGRNGNFGVLYRRRVINDAPRASR